MRGGAPADIGSGLGTATGAGTASTLGSGGSAKNTRRCPCSPRGGSTYILALETSAELSCQHALPVRLPFGAVRPLSSSGFVVGPHEVTRAGLPESLATRRRSVGKYRGKELA